MRAIAFAALLLLATPASAQQWTSLRPVDAAPPGYSEAEGDFDGDNRADHAGFYMQGREVVLAVRLSSSPRAPVIIWRGPLNQADAYGVEQTDPGIIRTACGRSLRCGQGQRREVRLNADGLILTHFEAPAEYLYFWTGSAFEHELINE